MGAPGVFSRADGPAVPDELEGKFGPAFPGHQVHQAEFAEIGLGNQVHWVKPELVGHISRDATAIKGREKPTVKPRPPKLAPRPKGCPRRGEVREPRAETRLERQCRQSAPGALAELPVHCDVGTKKNSQGYKETWRAYKWLADVSD